MPKVQSDANLQNSSKKLSIAIYSQRELVQQIFLTNAKYCCITYD